MGMRHPYRHFSRRLLERYGQRIDFRQYLGLCRLAMRRLPNVPTLPSHSGRCQLALIHGGEYLRVILCCRTALLITVLPPLPSTEERMTWKRTHGAAHHWSKREGRRPYQRRGKSPADV
jgi:hypothetical protein